MLFYMSPTSFADGSTDSGTWAMTSMDGSVPFWEGFAGAASGQEWQLSQAGYTEGNVAQGTGQILGIWTLMNTSAQTITGFSIDALAGGVAFDTIFGSEETPGSQGGKEFFTFMGNVAPASPTATLPGITATLTDQLNMAYDDLFGTLSVAFAPGSELDVNASVNFWIDTDKVAKVNAPSTVGMLLMGMFLAARLSRRKG